MLQKPVTAVILGAGHRSLIYGDVSLSHPDVLKIVGVVDINPQKAEIAAARYGIDKSRVFYSVDELLKCGKIADIIINGGRNKTALDIVAAKIQKRLLQEE